MALLGVTFLEVRGVVKGVACEMREMGGAFSASERAPKETKWMRTLGPWVASSWEEGLSTEAEGVSGVKRRSWAWGGSGGGDGRAVVEARGVW